MRALNCRICQSDRKITLEDQTFRDDYLELINPTYQSQPRRLVICSGCGFVYHDPQLDAEDLEILYDKFRDSSFRNESPDAYFDRITGLPSGQSENAAKVEWIRSSIPECVAAGGDLLDIGCGGGVFIHSFLKAFPGWKACGVEPTPAFAELARRRLAVPVIAGAYRSGLHEGRRFNLITINQVLEHVGDPVTFLRDVHNDLAMNGLIYLEVPDIQDIGYLPPNHDRFLMQHLWVFSKISLTNVCRLAGYDIQHVDQQVTIRGKRNLVIVLKSANGPIQAGDLLRENPNDILTLKTRSSQS